MADWTDNPFAAPAEEAAEPFNDPSVTEAAASSTMPEYDPFANADAAPQTAKPKSTAKAKPVKAVAASKDIGGSEPDWAQPKETKPIVKKEPKKSSKQMKEEQKRQAEYEKNQRATQDGKKDPGFRPANWPPFPSRCVYPFKPCYHHDFKGELPDWGYGITRQLYYYWLAYFFALFWNFIGSCAAMSLNYSVTDTTQSMFLSLAYIIFFGFLGYACWFQALYQGMRKDSSLRFGWFFFTFSFQWLTCIFFLIGADGSGACGIINASSAVQDEAVVGILMFTAAICWGLLIIWATWIIRAVLLVYRSSGQSLARAQNEAVTGAVKAGAQASAQAAVSNA